MMVREIPYTAPQDVLDAVASLGRTEDVRFSPKRRRLAVAGFGRNRVVVFDIEIASSSNTTRIALTGAVELSSPALRLPHGLDFIDDNTLIVTGRGTGVALFDLPPCGKTVETHEVQPIAQWSARGGGGMSLLNVPGSVAVSPLEDGDVEVLICNNYGHTVTRHLLARDGKGAPKDSEILLQRYVNVPDSVSISKDRRWIAISNHGTHHVLLYENVPALDAHTPPTGILRGVQYPHGLRFSADGRHLFVVDAGAPYLHIYSDSPDQWRGVRDPAGTIKVMDDATFARGRSNPEEGGPKGLDIEPCSNVLVITSEYRRLAFFDVPGLLECASRSAHEQVKPEMDYELHRIERVQRLMAEADGLRSTIDKMRNGMSWRVTAPLRRLKAIFRPRRN